MIDLSTLIALLTALASAGVSSPPGPVESRAGQPPGQHCSSANSSQSGPADRQLEIPDLRSGTWPPPAGERSAPQTEGETDPEATRQLRDDDGGDNNDDNKESDKNSDKNSDKDDERGREKGDEKKDEKDSDGGDKESETKSDTRAPRSEPPDGDDSDRSSSRERSSSEKSSAGDDENPNSADRSTRPGYPTLPRPDVTRAAPSDDADAASDRRYPSPACPDPRLDPRPGSRSEPNPGSTDRPRDTPSGNVAAPSDLVDLGNWYLTLPTGSKGDPDTIQPAELDGYSSSYFQLNEGRDGVVFTAPVDGATTRNSDYPRSELREMNGEEEAAWSNGNGTHVLRATEAVTELPESKPELVTAQIHGGDDDILQIRLEGNHLMVQYADGAKQVTLDPDYRLGTPYDIEIRAAANSVQVGYNGEPKAELALSGSTWYFKAGAYVQSNPSKGDAATAAGQVVIYSLEVTHT